jgi:hypothetical protein
VLRGAGGEFEVLAWEPSGAVVLVDLDVLGELDDAGLDAGAFNAFLDFADPDGGDFVGVHALVDGRDPALDAGGADDVDGRAFGYSLEEPHLATEVSGSAIEDGVDAGLVDSVQCLDIAGDHFIVRE